jgi:tetratricopeptide (TPR) repeat protein
MPSPSPDLWNKMGITYQMLSDMKDAAHCYKESLRLDPVHAWALNNMGTVYDAQGDFDRAEGFYRKAYEADSDSARIAMNLGTNLMAQKKYGQGSDTYKRALALDPEVFDESEGPITQSGVPIEQRGAMNYYKARDYAQAGMIDRALKSLRKAMNQGYASATEIVQDSSFAALAGYLPALRASRISPLIALRAE